MKILVKIVILIVIFLAGFYFGQHYVAGPQAESNQPEISNLNQEENEVSLMLDFGNGEVKTFNDVQNKADSSVFELMKKITSANNLEFSYKDYGGDLGVMVESINGVSNNSEADHFWQYWVNNSYAQVGASNYQLKDGDVIEWKFIKGQF